MGLFSFLGKKDNEPDKASSEKDEARRKRDERTASSQILQRDAARATAMKIDAIESEMTSELIKPAKTPNSQLRKSAPPKPPANPASAPNDKKEAAQVAKSAQSALPVMGMTTDFLLGSEALVAGIEVSSSDTDPVIEEAAILFANEQTEMVEQVLLSAIQDKTPSESDRIIWWMLFDLYQITGKQAPFDNLSIEYANKFETSPPTWEGSRLDPQPAKETPLSAVPMIAFAGKLDESIVKQLERLQKMGENNKTVRLEFVRVTEVDPAGCGLLLDALKKLHKAGKDLIFVGAAELAEKIRSILEVGRRDETEAPWLLLLEILELLNREKDFEETSIDYCVTFEVSPPAFVPPKNKITMALEESVMEDNMTNNFMMPLVVDGRTDLLINSIKEYAANHNPAIIDCSRLTRVDFGAAGQLLSGLAPLAGNGRTIELINVNHLVAALFNVMGLRDIAQILPRKK
ncbi:MAG: STAS domain-containing protein [Burkholderiaceae bacterium]